MFKTNSSIDATNTNNKRIEINEKHNNKTIYLKKGDIVQLSLPSNPTTGYQWSIPSLSIIKSEYERILPNKVDGMPIYGSSGIEHWSFQLLTSGQLIIEGWYERSWEKKPQNPNFQVILKVE